MHIIELDDDLDKIYDKVRRRAQIMAKVRAFAGKRALQLAVYLRFHPLQGSSS